MSGATGRRTLTWRALTSTVLALSAMALGLALAAARAVGGEVHVPSFTVLGVMLGGFALLAQSCGHRKAGGGTAALLAGLLTAALASSGWHGITPAPSTAVALILVAAALLVAPRSPAGARSLALAALALAALGLGGRALELRSTLVGTMPPLAALGVALLSVAAFLQADERAELRADVAERYTPYAAGATCLLATVLFWQSLVQHQRAELHRAVEMTGVGALAELGAFMRSVTRALEHVAAEWDAAGRLPAEQWRYQSRLVLERLGGPRAVEWIDDEADVVYVVTPPKTAPLANDSREPTPAVDAEARAALATARRTQQAAVTPPFLSATDRPEFRLAMPLLRRGTPDGFVSALFSIDDMLDALLATRIHDYVITAHDGTRQVYGPRDVSGVAPCPTCRTYILDLPGNRSWEFSIRPSADLRATIESGFPQMILVSGMLISVLLTGMLRVLARERRTARDLARANRALHDEVASRRTAEQEIRTLAIELEQRVRDRTVELATSNTALRNENALRQRAQTTLESANRNLRHFASFVSHELRQPLATMALWGELLESNPEVGLNERGRGYLKQLRSSIDRMTGFLEAQLRLARVTYTQPTLEEDVDVAVLVKEVVGDGSLGLHGAGATVEIGDLPTIHADSGQLRQLFRNLLENAVKYRRPDAPLVIRIEGRVATRQGSRYCEFRVSDNGQGFSDTDNEKVFDLFEQLPGRKSGAGSGVGLAICRRIVEHHGGTIRAEGKPGTGATFIIDLPLVRCEGHDDDPRPELIQG